VRLSGWNHPGDLLYGMFARWESIVNSIEVLLEGEVYYYHSKVIMKDPKIGGAWAGHQDYGYWYLFGALFPLLASAYIAMDPATRENGCLQVVRGSHQLGRIDHVLTGEWTGADRERVNEILKRMELVLAEMEPSDTLFFHCNLLHRSDQNRSEKPRWSMILPREMIRTRMVLTRATLRSTKCRTPPLPRQDCGVLVTVLRM